MNSDRVNKWLTLGANLGVLIGIILLVLELNQNSAMIRAQTRAEISRGISDVTAMAATNSELADAIARANNGGELSPGERVMVGNVNEALFRYWENAHYQYRQGMYDESEFSTHLVTMRDVLLSTFPQMMEHWCSNRGHFSIPFTEEIDELLAEDGCK